MSHDATLKGDFTPHTFWLIPTFFGGPSSFGENAPSIRTPLDRILKTKIQESPANGSYYDLNISMWRLGANWAWNSCFEFQNNLKGADRSRQSFVHSATVVALHKDPAMSPPSSVHCGQYDTMGVTMLGGAYSEGITYTWREGKCTIYIYHEYMRNELKNEMKSTLDGQYFGNWLMWCA